MSASLPSLADSLIQALHQPGQERLLDLVRNPLRLTLLCITWDGTLPETQAQLYENYLKKFYGWNQNLQELRDCAERCQTNITALKKQLNQQLGELAKAALDLPKERFRLSQALVEKYLGEELDDQSLCYLALQLGWLNRVGKDKRDQFIFAFYHATFQEYFAALTVDDWDYFLPRNHVNFPVEGKEYRIFEPQWKQVILLWLGREDIGDDEKEGFIRALVEFK
ncbi:MAG: NACHT domain-containing protein, partial [Planktothrix sp.]